ncbi:MAG TPA: LLM class flavin-dependent oxidoreductase [Pyrinomonadaceae bacterium]|nr:LLM class flavin-dependent oxidoreductase [Pyrinomonadaceae bacterium]
MNLRFHWMLPKGGEVAVDGRQTAREAARYRIESVREDSPAPRPDVEGWLHFARRAEEAGVESVLISFSRYEPDPFLVGCALGQETEKLKYIIAYRSGLMQPTTFVQQLNTLSALIGGRVAVNIVAGSSASEQRGYGDFLEHDERYERAEEFLTVCHAFWKNDGEVDFDGRYYRVEKGKLHTPFTAPGRTAPEIYVSGHSEQAQRLALTRGSCYLRLIDTPEKLAPVVSRFRGQGIEVCLRLCVVCRRTRDEALAAAHALLPGEEIERQERAILSGSDSQTLKHALATADNVGWMNRSLWAGLVPFYGSSAITLVGSPAELAEAFIAYKKIGVTQFIIAGWPKLEEMLIFGREVLPLVREAERRLDGEPQERHDAGRQQTEAAVD